MNPLSDPLRSRIKRALLAHLRRKDFPRALALLADNHPHGLGLGNHLQRFGRDEAALQTAVAACEGYIFDPEKMKLHAPANFERFMADLARFVASHPDAVLSPAYLTRLHPWAGETFCTRALERLTAQGHLRREEGFYLPPARDRTDWRKALESAIHTRLKACGIRPLSPSRILDELAVDTALGARLLASLEKKGFAVRLSEGLWADAAAAQKMETSMRTLAETPDGADVQKIKTRFHLSRRQAVAWLEWLDTREKIRNVEQVRLGVGD